MRAWLGWALLLGGCDVVFGLDDPSEDLVTVRIVQDRAFVHDTPTQSDVVEPVPFTSGEVIAEARTGANDAPVATRYEDGAVVFEAPRGARYRAHVGDIEVQGIAGTDDTQTLGTYTAGSPDVTLPSNMPWLQVSDMPPYAVDYYAVMVTLGLWQSTFTMGHPKTTTDIRFELDGAERLSKQEPIAVPDAAQGDANYMVRKLKDPNERVVEAWSLPAFGPGQRVVSYNSLVRSSTPRCANLDVDVPAVQHRFDPLLGTTTTPAEAFLQISTGPRPDYITTGFTLLVLPLALDAPLAGIDVPYVDPFARSRTATVAVTTKLPGSDAVIGAYLTLAADAAVGDCDALAFSSTSFAVPSLPTLAGHALADDGVEVTLRDEPLVSLDWTQASEGPHDFYLVVLTDRSTGTTRTVRTWYTTTEHLEVSSGLLEKNHRYQIVLFSVTGVPGAATLDFSRRELPSSLSVVTTGRFTINR